MRHQRIRRSATNTARSSAIRRGLGLAALCISHAASDRRKIVLVLVLTAPRDPHAGNGPTVPCAQYAPRSTSSPPWPRGLVPSPRRCRGAESRLDRAARSPAGRTSPSKVPGPSLPGSRTPGSWSRPWRRTRPVSAADLGSWERRP
uniref:Putative secreted protein n=1 Tax=Ixodes ricinus TaxID=34613 RepID=A0A6B0UUL3_IXORI